MHFIIFLMLRIGQRKLLFIGAIITVVTFTLLQIKTLPYQLTTMNSSLPDTNHFEITPLIRDNQSEAINPPPFTPLLNSSTQLVESNALVQEKVKVTPKKIQIDVIKPNISTTPIFSSDPVSRQKRYLVRFPNF